VAGEAAILLDPREPTQWAQALAELVNDKARRQSMIRQGLERSARFTWEACADTVLRVLERVGQS